MRVLPLPLRFAAAPLARWHALLALLLAGLVLVLGGCVALTGPRVVSVSEAQLAQRIAEQFPVRRRYLELFDLTLSAPRVRLIPAENRVGTRMDFALGDFWGGSRRFDGALSLSYGLRFEPSDASVRMTDVRVEAFDVPRLSGPMANQAQRLGALVAEHLLNDFSLHRFKPEDLQSAQRLGLRPGVLKVVPGGLQLELTPHSH
ncbi:hypothetical protein [Hydrogenophaga defluvii]|uniref:DUF1439 domain-containing protein n=1 Tax=Hydrogenophaga defluvii TaxID=249410 RepID=A0ABW2SA87_9BURK